ncbi:acyl-CoA dehydratase activase [Halanaerobacter jeridensis]|uniref:CoA-substrate-specific enzyme activase n=1 Tax=Halanaerobacter jeridensis TaxID=706427 RepID=A0A939BS08_9FIRM|nr:acyl-CoA dehydratase activase [Halanaerobacter jeridensis]MBM7557874.1 putative CoA-substrate-specific enzyme activase [Halanaerobacter jeridensis]
MRVLGIDLGSREVKVIVLEEGEIVNKFKVSTMSFYRDYCTFSGKIVVDLDKLDIGETDVKISTGYGRNNTDLNEFEVINEVKAHAYGAIYQSGLENFILLDVGGQDVKAVQVEKGLITDIELNEKCAASCGRYLENMAKVLEVSLEELATYSTDPVDLNSTCAVFSESELIGKIAEGASIERLCAGVNYSMYRRLKPLLTGFKGHKLVISGGVAFNQAIIEYLAQDYEQVITLDHPQYNGAIGSCYYGQEISNK